MPPSLDTQCTYWHTGCKDLWRIHHQQQMTTASVVREKVYCLHDSSFRLARHSNFHSYFLFLKSLLLNKFLFRDGQLEYLESPKRDYKSPAFSFVANPVENFIFCWSDAQSENLLNNQFFFDVNRITHKHSIWPKDQIHPGCAKMLAGEWSNSFSGWYNWIWRGYDGPEWCECNSWQLQQFWSLTSNNSCHGWSNSRISRGYSIQRLIILIFQHG